MRIVDLNRRRETVYQIPQDLLVSEWKLEETTGNIFSDSKGTNHGNDTDIPNLTTVGKVGNGFDWQSIYGSSVVPHSSDFVLNDGTGNKDFSFCFWIYRTGGGSLIPLLNLTNIVFFGTVQNLLRLEFRDNNNTQYAKTASDSQVGIIDSNVWIHLGVSFKVIDANTNEVRIYKNGSEIATNGNVNAHIRNNITPDFNIGGNSFSGPLDEIKFYHKALTSEEVSSIYNAEL